MLKEPGLDQHDKVLALTTISFDISGLELYLPLLVGREIILTDVQTSRDTRHLMDIVRQQGVNGHAGYTCDMENDAGICLGGSLTVKSADR
ncbi:hypothetical protein [Chitinophaga pinensis]|uniref:Uncharacterized protein n=1 Tax=Chitinophaga pinensis TaxID=79329 RepID=A0A5C6LSA7_9BACT|nr:hypothetical protein [Chitinophaga pinensis]TWV99791.1 hypothetical protein FEF09_15190 [Chitinophaga pinensis]